MRNIFVWQLFCCNFVSMYKFLIFISFALVYNTLDAQEASIKWAPIDTLDAVLNDESNQKQVFIDVYTDWCGWCKRMDATTFSDPEVVKIMNKYFVPVKFDAEQKEPIAFGGKQFKFIDNGRRGYNELAASLLQEKMSYPTVVFLDENAQMIQPLPGYRSAKDLKPILVFIGKKIYKEQSYEDFLKTYEKEE